LLRFIQGSSAFINSHKKKLIMKKYLKMLAFATVAIGFVSCSDDDDDSNPPSTVTFASTINGASEVPANASTATGTATGTYNTNTNILTVNVTYSGVTATAAHIHEGAIGVSGPPIFTFPSLTSPMSLTTVALTTAQETALMNNNYYINIHSAAFPDGEIRGQLIKQ
jgi:hypothetical protein